jgi:hypothetical protein
MEKMYPLELWIGNTKIAQTQQIQEVSNNRGLVQGVMETLFDQRNNAKWSPSTYKYIDGIGWNGILS